MYPSPSSFSFHLKALLLISVVAGLTVPAFAETYSGEQSNRLTIKIGDTPWKFSRTDPYPGAKDISYSDASWSDVGIPHCFNANDSWLNITRGIVSNSSLNATAWYRKRFTVDAAHSGKRIELEFQGVNIGCAVYINGKFKPNIHAVSQPGEATHVNGHLPFVVDITDDVKFGAENVIAVRVSNDAGGSKFFTTPSIGTSVFFGMAFGGIHRPVFLHITDKVHVPLNVYSNIRRWGSYVATTEVSADRTSATVKLQTNVYNDGTQDKPVTVLTKIVDANKIVVWAETAPAQTVAANGNLIFNQTATIANPKLWYPNNHPDGKPYMHRVYHIVQVNGQTVDVFESPLGIRVITWDKDFAYVNGAKHLFWGFGSRYEYPGFGSAVPAEQQWRDMKLLAECGGSMLRPGHAPIATATVEACDAYGVCLFECTMDNEWALDKSDSDIQKKLTYKDEYHRDCIIRDRNNPSLAVWELNNGCQPQGKAFIHPAGFIKKMVDTIRKYDHFKPRAASTRDGTDYTPLEPGVLIMGTVFKYSRLSQNLPAWGAESWQSSNARFSYEYELGHVASYTTETANVISTKGCGLTHWMFMECSGENYKAFGDAGIGIERRKTLGGAAVDHNRIPKLIYHVYKNALWVPYTIRPGVALQCHWNYAAGKRTVTAFSNCPSVDLILNGVSKGVKTPDATTKKCEWTVDWESGTLRAEGRNASGTKVCSDERKTAGPPSKIILTAERAITRPDNGAPFLIRANGTDAGFVLATIVDAQGNWCPLATNEITFSTTGQGVYIGSANYLADPSKPVSYHAPGDFNLSAEGGMMKIAVRSTFTPGSFTVNASATGLTAAEPVIFSTVKVDSVPPVANRSVAFIPQQTGGARSRLFKTTGSSFLVPREFSGKPVSVKIYNLSGKLLRETVVKERRVTLRSCGIGASGTYIVRCREIAGAR